MLLNDAGGDAYTSADLNFSDTADRVLETADDAPTSVEMRPASFGSVTSPVSAATAGIDLAVFKDSIAKGTWRLYVNDDEDHGNSDGGELYGWSLQFQLATTPYPSTLSVSGIGEVTDVNVTLHDLDSDYPRTWTCCWSARRVTSPC